jgi:hypothetical protein
MAMTMPADDTHAIRNGDILVTAPSAIGAALLYRAAVLSDAMALATLINLSTQSSADEVLAVVKEMREQIAMLTAGPMPDTENAE